MFYFIVFTTFFKHINETMNQPYFWFHLLYQFVITSSTYVIGELCSF